MAREDTRDLIRKAALELMTQEGSGAFRKSRLAEATGLSKQVIQYHYPDLVPLLIEIYAMVAKFGQQTTIDTVAKASTPAETLGAVIDGAFTWLRQHPAHGPFFLVMYHWSSVEPRLQEMHLQILEGGLARIRHALLESFKYKSKEEVETHSLTIHNLMLGCVLRMVSTNDSKNYKKYVRHLREGVGQLFGETIPAVTL